MGCTNSRESSPSVNMPKPKHVDSVVETTVDPMDPEVVTKRYTGMDNIKVANPAEFVQAYLVVDAEAWLIGSDQSATISHEPPDAAMNTPSTPIILRFVDEGAANVVWSIEAAPDHNLIPPHHQEFLEEKLLRLRKGTKSIRFNGTQTSPPPFISSREVFQHYNVNIKPNFNESELINQKLVTITQGVVQACNNVLDTLEEMRVRKQKRWGWHIEHGERSGLLITSMLPKDDESILVQLKPKWLAQSPGAPPNARRCRTCAIQASRRTDRDHLPVCPLTLISGDKHSVQKSLTKLPKSAISPLPPFMERNEVIEELTSFFTYDDDNDIHPELDDYGHRLLLNLRDLQTCHDPQGVLKVAEMAPEEMETQSYVSESDQTTPTQAQMDRHINKTEPKLIKDLGLAMTLRDCTLFIKMWKDEDSSQFHLDARLADLDPKSSDHGDRFQRWVDAETMLIKGGWYEGTEMLKKGDQKHEECMLWSGEDSKPLERQDTL